MTMKMTMTKTTTPTKVLPRIASATLAPLLLLTAVGGCDHAATSPSNLPTTTMSVGGKPYTLEVAAHMHDRNTGLMYRDAMPEDHGMIFVFGGEEKRGFWMKNTRIPLDIVFLDANGMVTTVHRMEPYDTTNTTSSEKPAKYAIELNAGQAAKAGVKAGDAVAVPESIQKLDADP